MCVYTGGRTAEAIVDAALNALRSLALDRLNGRGGGQDHGRQVVIAAFTLKLCYVPHLCSLIFHLQQFKKNCSKSNIVSLFFGGFFVCVCVLSNVCFLQLYPKKKMEPQIQVGEIFCPADKF